jgi:hypothetical protein
MKGTKSYSWRYRELSDAARQRPYMTQLAPELPPERTFVPYMKSPYVSLNGDGDPIVIKGQYFRKESPDSIRLRII